MLPSSSNPDTVATLTKNYLDGGVRVLVSTLRILATAEAPNGSVTCIHTDGTTNETTRFKVLNLGKFKHVVQNSEES